MGIDVNLYVEADPSPEELAAAEEFFTARSGIGDPWERYGNVVLVRDSEEWFASPRVNVCTMSRYYGPGYERGPWPDIYGAIRTLQAAFPEAKVFYGGDTSDDGIECTDERWHFAAHASSPEGGYASLGVENALIKVARIKAAARREALLEAAEHLDAISRHHDPGDAVREWADHNYPGEGA